MLLSRGLFAGVSSGRAPVGSPEADSGFVSRGGRFDGTDLPGRRFALALRTRRSVSRVSNSCLTPIAFDGSPAPPSLSASSLSCALTCEGIGISSCYHRRSNSTPSGPARLDSVHVLEPVATASGHIVTPSDEFPEALLYRGIAAHGEPLKLRWVLQHLGQTRIFLMSSNGRVRRVGVGISLI